jgi:hypothetical protein
MFQRFLSRFPQAVSGAFGDENCADFSAQLLGVFERLRWRLHCKWSAQWQDSAWPM